MEARRKAENPDAPEVKNFSRARLKSLMGECKSLLDALGISSVKAVGKYQKNILEVFFHGFPYSKKPKVFLRMPKSLKWVKSKTHKGTK